MICEFCGGKTTKKKVRKQHWFHGNLYLIENVETEVCGECGERYFHAKTLDAIDYCIVNLIVDSYGFSWYSLPKGRCP